MTDDDYAINEQTSKQHWEDLLRKMLPAGAPLPDEDQLDYSISVEYQPPTRPHNNNINHHSLSRTITTTNPIPIIKNSNFTKPPKIHHKYTSATTNLAVSLVTQASETGEDEISNVLSFDTTQEEEEEEDNNDSSTSVTASPVVETGGKKNQKKNICSRCGNGNRLKEKEGCIVCDARYCSNCLLKAMGSMPEGRKCVGCIGQPIDESRRQRLGKCSRMLSKICSPLEARQIMLAEKECFANQLRPEQLVVNGRQLRQEDLCELLGCRVPPLKLKPGKYWYDKDSGLWGQEGEKPDRIVSSKLNVGGKLQMDASNGNTQVYINGREITKVELRVLKLAKVQCPQGTHFWLYDDGSYEEEGQNNIKGNIWGKASTRFISSLFCLPVPHEPCHGLKLKHELSRSIITQNLEHSTRVDKLMLFGLEGSGTSTIFKQVRFLYGDKLSSEELQHLKLMIQSNTYRYLSVLLEGRERFEEEDGSESVYSFKPKFKHFSDWLLDIMAMGDFENYFPAATREYAPLVDEIWKDPAIQETYKRRDELNFLPDVAKYFLDQTIELSSNDYEPSEKDILYAQGVTPTNGLSCLDFSFRDHSPMSTSDDENGQSPLIRFQLLGMKLHDGCKWLDMFEDARLVIFCVALSDYDQVWAHKDKDNDDVIITENKMLANRDLFERLAKQACFADIPFVLILNKYDIFEEKIGRTPLSVCEWFSDFGAALVKTSTVSLANQAYYYVGIKFKEVYAGITGRKLFVWQSVGRERGSVQGGISYITEVIRWDQQRHQHLYAHDDDHDNTSFYTHSNLIVNK
ncbi:unnamed protein product [Lactuca virosa]|uniref:Extra-large guanine nucleotide-binding protein 3 n=1 Tax=Lactuca virosa TaxID=75947 RepID=A0AAU9MVI0_9ASTR|nr:unnamed protein product [Lactuca virosa]